MIQLFQTPLLPKQLILIKRLPIQSSLRHAFFAEERASIRDVREIPIQYGGYSISYRRGGRTQDGKPDPKWHSHVEIVRRPYYDLESHFLDMARHRDVKRLTREFYQFPFEPYAPIRRQMLKLLRKVNRIRKKAGYPRLPPNILPMRRRVVKPFQESSTSAEYLHHTIDDCRQQHIARRGS